MHEYARSVIDAVKARDPGEPEFHQAVTEVFEAVAPVLDAHSEYRQARILERLVEPERVIVFRVPWVDDRGDIQVNRGFRVQMNSAIGPYKGGLRFHPSVNLSTMKFLAFEQTFKNSLTTLPMGGAKGGSDFQTRGKSDAEVMRFCRSFMTELHRHVGPHTDVPAGDVGVGAREIGFLFGEYRRLRNEFTGVLTGKSLSWGGSLVRPEATGYGVAYFLTEMLAARGDSPAGKTIAISGYGNVGSFFVQKAVELGAKVVSLGDEYGCVFDPDGISGEKLAYMADLWTVHRKSAKDYADRYDCEWKPGERPWRSIKCDIAVPTAMQNEIDIDDAHALVANGCRVVCEAANMPCTPQAIRVFKEAGVLYAPGKAANAGGVATSGLEMTQNSMRQAWSREEVDGRLHQIMTGIHAACLEAAERYGSRGEYATGANIAGFLKVADAMMDQGVV
ncbi:MAG: NADP-specific glutamate dehydrogenase [Thermoleophilia bacterium]|nr:NADP-specific glutamate dehydrogenase [Thermoleophilia bacterium]